MILNFLKIQFQFEAVEVEIMQDLYLHLLTKRLPASLDDVVLVNETLLLLKKFEAIRVQKMKRGKKNTYTRTLYVHELLKLREIDCFFKEEAAFEINQWRMLYGRVDAAIQKWEGDVFFYKEPKYQLLGSGSSGGSVRL